MNKKEFKELRTKLYAECDEISDKKGSDYSGEKDVFANFKSLAQRLGSAKYTIWAVYFVKHIDAILKSIERDPNSPHRKGETVEESIRDGINYLTLFFGMLKEDEQNDKTN